VTLRRPPAAAATAAAATAAAATAAAAGKPENPPDARGGAAEGAGDVRLRTGGAAGTAGGDEVTRMEDVTRMASLGFTYRQSSSDGMWRVRDDAWPHMWRGGVRDHESAT
jgi:hypothetical protein